MHRNRVSLLVEYFLTKLILIIDIIYLLFVSGLVILTTANAYVPIKGNKTQMYILSAFYLSVSVIYLLLCLIKELDDSLIWRVAWRIVLMLPLTSLTKIYQFPFFVLAVYCSTIGLEFLKRLIWLYVNNKKEQLLHFERFESKNSKEQLKSDFQLQELVEKVKTIEDKA